MASNRDLVPIPKESATRTPDPTEFGPRNKSRAAFNLRGRMPEISPSPADFKAIIDLPTIIAGQGSVQSLGAIWGVIRSADGMFLAFDRRGAEVSSSSQIATGDWVYYRRIHGSPETFPIVSFVRVLERSCSISRVPLRQPLGVKSPIKRPRDNWCCELASELSTTSHGMAMPEPQASGVMPLQLNEGAVIHVPSPCWPCNVKNCIVHRNCNHSLPCQFRRQCFFQSVAVQNMACIPGPDYIIPVAMRPLCVRTESYHITGPFGGSMVRHTMQDPRGSFVITHREIGRGSATTPPPVLQRITNMAMPQYYDNLLVTRESQSHRIVSLRQMGPLRQTGWIREAYPTHIKVLTPLPVSRMPPGTRPMSL